MTFVDIKVLYYVRSAMCNKEKTCGIKHIKHRRIFNINSNLYSMYMLGAELGNARSKRDSLKIVMLINKLSRRMAIILIKTRDTTQTNIVQSIFANR